MTFTPVTKESFEAWYTIHYQKYREAKFARMTENDLKPTGKYLFEAKGKLIEEIKEEEDATAIEGDMQAEEEKDEEEQECFYYDKALFAKEEGLDDEEEPDFD